MYNTREFQQMQEDLFVLISTCKVLLEYLTKYMGVNSLNIALDKLIPTKVISLTTQNYSSKETDLLRDISFCVVGAYDDDTATLIQDVSYQVKDNKLIVRIVTAYPGLLIGKGGRAIDNVRKTLQEEFINKKENFTDVDINIVENRWSAKNYILSY